MADLSGKKVAILATDGFEEDELIKPRDYLQDKGAKVDVVSIKEGSIRAWHFTNWSQEVPVDRTVDECSVDDYDALILPGGQINPDKLRMNEQAVAFVRDFFHSGKPLAAVCHGPWMLIEAGVVKGLTVTSFPSLRTDLKNAGAEWVDKEVVTQQGVITSRNPGNLDAFSAKIAEEIREGVHHKRKAA